MGLVPISPKTTPRAPTTSAVLAAARFAAASMRATLCPSCRSSGIAALLRETTVAASRVRDQV